MSVNLNLVDNKVPEASKVEETSKLRGFSYLILIITAFSAIIIFALDYRFSASYVKKQQADVLNELSSYDAISAKIFIINSNLSDIAKLLAERKKYSTTTKTIIKNIKDPLIIDKYSIDEAGAAISISSVSLSPIDEFINATLNLIKTKELNGVVLKSLTFEGERYILEIEII